MDDPERRRAALAFAFIVDMAGDGASTKASIRELALKHMRELRVKPIDQAEIAAQS
jgi:hypothetical protein